MAASSIQAPIRRRLIAGLAVALYFTFWALSRQQMEKNFGPVFGVVADLLFFFPIVFLVRSLGPVVGHRRNAWLLVFIPLFGFFVVGGAIYRLVLLPHRPWEGTVLPHDWTRGFRVAVALGLCVCAGFWVLAVSKQSWPIERTIDDAVAKKLQPWKVTRSSATCGC